MVQTPAAEMGMGTATVQIQHAADRLGLPMERVTFQYGDSKLPDTPVMAGGSNQTASIFAAVQAAVEEIHRELAEAGAEELRFAAGAARSTSSWKLATAGCIERRPRATGETYAAILRRAKRDVGGSRNRVRRADGDDEVLHGILWRAVLRSAGA